MKYQSITGAVLALTFAVAAGAQTHAATGAVVKPNVNPTVAQTTARPAVSSAISSPSGAASSAGFMSTGAYLLSLHIQKKDGHAVSGGDLDMRTTVARSGNGMTISDGSSTSLTGTVTGSHFTASGAQSNGTSLSLSGASAPNASAAGTFTLHAGSDNATGTFTMAPTNPLGPNTTQKIRNYGEGSGSEQAPCGIVCTVEKILSGLHW